MKILAIGTEKGGTSKTTTAAALGSLLAADGLKVLLVDADPQSSLTQNFGKEAAGRSLAEVIGGATRGPLSLSQIIQPITKNLDIAPSDLALASGEFGLVQRTARESVLRSALATVQGYDLAIVDCPPSLGLLTIAALTAADGVIVPTLPSAIDLRGVRLFLDTIEQTREHLNPGLEFLGIVLAQFDPRLISHRQALETLKVGGLEVLATIPRSVKVQEASALQEPITVYDPESRPAVAYHELKRKVKAWLKSKPR